MNGFPMKYRICQERREEPRVGQQKAQLRVSWLWLREQIRQQISRSGNRSAWEHRNEAHDVCQSLEHQKTLQVRTEVSGS